jgi:hypothetical protein
MKGIYKQICPLKLPIVQGHIHFFSPNILSLQIIHARDYLLGTTIDVIHSDFYLRSVEYPLLIKLFWYSLPARFTKILCLVRERLWASNFQASTAEYSRTLMGSSMFLKNKETRPSWKPNYYCETISQICVTQTFKQRKTKIMCTAHIINTPSSISDN